MAKKPAQPPAKKPVSNRGGARDGAGRGSLSDKGGISPLLTFRVPAEMRKRWEAAAKRANMGLHDWMRQELDAAAGT